MQAKPAKRFGAIEALRGAEEVLPRFRKIRHPV